jgi:hypothetical protein
MMDQREATLDELLSEPIILKVMARDGVRAEDIRKLVAQASVRTRYRHSNFYAKCIAGRRADLTL